MEEQIRISFFRHYTNAKQDEKIIQLLRKEQWQGYGIYWALLEFLTPIKDHKAKCEYDAIAWDLRVDEAVIKRIVENYGLFVVKNGYFWSKSLTSQLDETAENIKRKKAAASRAGKSSAEKRKAANTNSNDSSTDVAENPTSVATDDGSPLINDIHDIHEIDREDIFPSNEAKNLPSSSSVEVVQPSTSKSKEEEEEEKLLEEKINKGEIQLFKKIEDVPVEIRKSFEEFWQLFRPDQSQAVKYKVSLLQWNDMDPKFREAVLRWLRDGNVTMNRNPYFFLQHVRPQFLNKSEQLQLHKAGKKLVSVRLDGKQWVCTAYVADLFQLDILDPDYNKKFE